MSDRIETRGGYHAFPHFSSKPGVPEILSEPFFYQLSRERALSLAKVGVADEIHRIYPEIVGLFSSHTSEPK